MFCSKCGKRLKEGSKFCISCGTAVSSNSKSENEKMDDDLGVIKECKFHNVDSIKEDKFHRDLYGINEFNDRLDIKTKKHDFENLFIGILSAVAAVLIMIIIYGTFWGQNSKYLSFLSINKKAPQIQNTQEDKKTSQKDSSTKSEPSSLKQSQNINLGITSGNLINCSFVLEDKGTIYYSNFSQGFKLYKMTSDGLDIAKLNDNDSGYFTQNGDYIYYSNDTDSGKMYSIKKDGSVNTKICDDKVSYLQFLDGFIYYKNENDSGKVYRISPEGNSREALSDACDIYNISSEYLYYLNNGKLKKKNLKDGQETLIGYSISKMIVDNNEVYYTDNGENGLYKMDCSGNNKSEICSDDVPIFNVTGNEVFYRNKSDDNKLYKITADGKNKKKISDTPIALIISVGDYIYCNATDKTMFKIKKDGTDQQSILK